MFRGKKNYALSADSHLVCRHPAIQARVACTARAHEMEKGCMEECGDQGKVEGVLATR
jgi:hypothetical protein